MRAEGVQLHIHTIVLCLDAKTAPNMAQAVPGDM